MTDGGGFSTEDLPGIVFQFVVLCIPTYLLGHRIGPRAKLATFSATKSSFWKGRELLAAGAP